MRARLMACVGAFALLVAATACGESKEQPEQTPATTFSPQETDTPAPSPSPTPLHLPAPSPSGIAGSSPTAVTLPAEFRNPTATTSYTKIVFPAGLTKTWGLEYTYNCPKGVTVLYTGSVLVARMYGGGYDGQSMFQAADGTKSGTGKAYAPANLDTAQELTLHVVGKCSFGLEYIQGSVPVGGATAVIATVPLAANQVFASHHSAVGSNSQEITVPSLPVNDMAINWEYNCAGVEGLFRIIPKNGLQGLDEKGKKGAGTQGAEPGTFEVISDCEWQVNVITKDDPS